MELTLEDGRPLETAGRMEKEIRVYDLLDLLGITYQRIDHAPVTTMEACRAMEAELKAEICKNLFLCNRQKSAYYLLMLAGEKTFRTKEISAQIESARLSFAGAEDMGNYLDIEPGAVSVLGLMNDTENRVRLLVDKQVLMREYTGCHPCVNTSSVKLRTKDVFERFLPAVHHDMMIVHVSG